MENKINKYNILGARAGFPLVVTSSQPAKTSGYKEFHLRSTLVSCVLHGFVIGELPLQSLAQKSALLVHKSTKVMLILWLFIFSNWQLKAQNQLKDYLQKAEKNNPGLQAVYKEYQAAMLKIVPAKALPDPVLTAAYFLQPIETKLGPQVAKVGLAQSFPWFGTLKEQGNAVALLAEAKLENYNQVKTDLFSAIEQKFYQLYFKNQQVILTDSILGYLNYLNEIVNSKLSVGKTSAVNKLRVEMEIAELKDKIRLFKDEYKSLESQFLDLINDSTLQSIQIPDKLEYSEFKLTPDEVFNQILNQNYTLKSLDKKIKAFESFVKVEQKKSLPKINLGVDYTFVGKGTNTGSDAGKDAFILPKVGITIPINRKKYKALINEKQLEQESIQDQKRNLELRLHSLLVNVLKDIEDNAKKYELNIYLSSLSHHSLQLLKASYLSDNIDFEEVLRMERQFLKYRLSTEKAITNYKINQVKLQQLIGM